jgi:hypothetical protein
LARRVIDQPILPFAGIAVLSDRRIERGVPAEPDSCLLRCAR